MTAPSNYNHSHPQARAHREILSGIQSRRNASKHSLHRRKNYKRIIVLCDGTWQDGIAVQERWQYTNILRLARTINSQDESVDPPIPQIVFYQSGIGSEKNFYSQFVEGTTGASLGGKVEEAYAFIAHNYCPGDEIFLFGFSRGAYTARMVAMFIGDIGVLDRRDMDSFATIFLAYQKRGKSKDEEEIKELNQQLEPWTSKSSAGKQRSDSDADSFSIKCVGVFDTVGSLGLPEELMISKNMRTLFGFPDHLLGEHIERAYHALALDEKRKNFTCTKFEQTEGGRRKGQILKQCWFTGAHTDIGGGYEDRDLADLTLAWMGANISELLSLDGHYLAALPKPVEPWGELSPHDSATGIFSLASTEYRPLPSSNNHITHETIHPSVLKQRYLRPELQELIRRTPIVCALLPLEEELKARWSFNDHAHSTAAHRLDPAEPLKALLAGPKNANGTEKIASKITSSKQMETEGGEPVYEKNVLGRMADKFGL